MLPHCHIYCEQLYKFGKEILKYNLYMQIVLLQNMSVILFIINSTYRREFHIRSENIIIPESEMRAGHTVKSAMRC